MLLAALLCLSTPSVWAQSNVCTVEANNPNSSIQTAVDSGCSEIRVTPGTYHENVFTWYHIHAPQISSGRSVSLLRSSR